MAGKKSNKKSSNKIKSVSENISLPPQKTKAIGKPGEEKPESKKRKLWIVIPAVTSIVALIAFFSCYFYFKYYLKPSFENNSFNKIFCSTEGEVIPGKQINYSIYFKNTGNLKITSFFIKTSIPENTEFLSASLNSAFDSSTGSLEFKVGEVLKNSSGKVSFTVKVKNPLDNHIRIKSSPVVFEYIVRGKKEFFKISEGLENVVKSSPDFSDFEISFVDLNGGKISMGDDIEFDIILKNSGNMDAKNVQVINRLPEKFSLYNESLVPEAAFNSDSREIVWNIKNLPTGEVISLVYKSKIGDEFKNLEVFRDTAQVLYNGKVEKEIYIEDKVWGFPDFSSSSNTVEDIDGGSIWAGDILKYVITVKNTGLRKGENFKLICPIPDATTYIENLEEPSDHAKYNSDEKVITWDIESLEVSQEKVFSFNAKISSTMVKGGKIESAFYIEGDDQYVEIESATISVRSYIFVNIVCMGDSQIPVSNWPESLDYLLESRYPHAEYSTIGSGIPQQMAYQGVKRFDSTVAVYQPKIVVIGYGTNDVGAPGGTSSFANAMTELINKAKSIGATPVVHSIGYIDTGINPAKKGYLSYNAVLQDVCANNGVSYVDIYGPMSDDPGRYILSDGMHWTPDGGALVANLVFNTIVNYLDIEGNRK
jgi:uncharacterized repeat protein (TIGR01451 family)